MKTFKAWNTYVLRKECRKYASIINSITPVARDIHVSDMVFYMYDNIMEKKHERNSRNSCINYERTTSDN